MKLTGEEQVFLNGLGRQVHILRQNRNFTQAELAEQAGIGAKYAGEIERGRTNPTMRLVWRLGQALGVETYELFLFSPQDGEQDGRRRVQLIKFLQDRRGRELERMAHLIQLLSLEP